MIMVQIYARFNLLIFNTFSALKFHMMAPLASLRYAKFLPCDFLGTDTLFKVSKRICVNKIDCNVSLSTSVAGIVWVSINWRIKFKRSNVSRSSVLLINQFLTMSLQHMVILSGSVRNETFLHLGGDFQSIRNRFQRVVILRNVFEINANLPYEFDKLGIDIRGLNG